MRTNNPILSRPDAFTRGGTTQRSADGFQADYTYAPQRQAGYGQQPGFGPQDYGQPQDYAQQYPGQQVQQGRMSIEDVITKTAIVLLTLVATAGLAWLLMPIQLLLPVALGSSLMAFVTVMFVSSRQKVPVAGVFVYAVLEGLLVGAWSKVFEMMYPGIVMQAVLGTLVAAFVVLGAYQFLGARIRGKVQQIFVVAIIGYAVTMLINLLLSFAGINLGLAAVGASAGPLAWLWAGLGVVLATGALLMDFDAIESGVRNGAPESESWRAALGLIVTLVWLYTLILRILSFFRD